MNLLTVNREVVIFEFFIDFQEFLEMYLEIIPLQESLKPVLLQFGKSPKVVSGLPLGVW